MSDDRQQRKLSVNMPIGGRSIASVLAVNSDLVRDWQCDTTFGPDGNSSPHVTIAMGLVALKRETLEGIDHIVQQHMHRVHEPALRFASFSSPYRESLTGRYLFCDVFFNPEMAQWRLDLAESLDPLFLEPARTTQEAHLTVGHIAHPDPKVDDYLLRCGPVPGGVLNAIDVSLAGQKGRKGSVLSTMRWTE